MNAPNTTPADNDDRVDARSDIDVTNDTDPLIDTLINLFETLYNTHNQKGDLPAVNDDLVVHAELIAEYTAALHIVLTPISKDEFRVSSFREGDFSEVEHLSTDTYHITHCAETPLQHLINGFQATSAPITATARIIPAENLDSKSTADSISYNNFTDEYRSNLH